MKNLLMTTVLIILAGCSVSGSPLNNARPMTKVDNTPADTRDLDFAQSWCRSTVLRQVDGIGGPSDPDYDGLFNACMAERGYLPRQPLTRGNNAAPSPETNR